MHFEYTVHWQQIYDGTSSIDFSPWTLSLWNGLVIWGKVKTLGFLSVLRIQWKLIYC